MSHFVRVASLDSDFTVCVVFFGHLTDAVEDLRHKHIYRPVPIEQKCPALAHVLNEISAGKFGQGQIYEPCVPPSHFLR